MKLSKLIKDAETKGLISIGAVRLAGKANPVFDMIRIMAKTRELEPLESVDFSRN